MRLPRALRHIVNGALAVGLASGIAWAAQTTITFVVPAPVVVSTAVACSPIAIPPAPAAGSTLPAGFQVCPIAVSPQGWVGALTVSDTADFTIATVSGVPTLETAKTLPAGSYPVTITATP